jgi:hypothetical protein
VHVVSGVLGNRRVDDQVHDLADRAEQVGPERFAAHRVRFGQRVVVERARRRPRPELRRLLHPIDCRCDTGRPVAKAGAIERLERIMEVEKET